MRRLIPVLLMSLGLFGLSGEAAQARGLSQPICESLLYKADPSDELYTINVVGLIEPTGDYSSDMGVVFMGFEHVTLNVLEHSRDVESALTAIVEDDHAVVEIEAEGQRIVVLDYQTGEWERPDFYVQYVTAALVGECIGQIDSPLRGEIVSSLAIELLWLHCNTPDSYMLLCSPFFLSRETAQAAEMSLDRMYRDEDYDSFFSDRNSDGLLERIMSRILSFDVMLKDPCLLFSAYIGLSACERLFDEK